MNNLYQELRSRKLEVMDEGIPSSRGPTSLELRAAKAIQTLVGVNENNNTLIQQMQLREMQQLDDIVKYRKDIEELAQQKILYNELLTKGENERILDGEREASEMGGGQYDLFGGPGNGESLS